MNKPKKKLLKKPTLPRPIKRRKGAEERVREAFANVPRITNETIAEHREDVLRGARKYIYPLKHSRRRAVLISSSIFVAAVLIFMVYVGLSLYRFQSTSGFLYGVTKVVPLPVAKAGSSWVSYNSYLFELRHNMHYYETQQGVDFSSESGKEQLARFKQQALDQVINDAYVKQLAERNDVSVSDRQVADQIALVRGQNRLGSSEEEYREVLQEFWGWTENDFKRTLKQQLLTQAVVAKLDTSAQSRAQEALDKITAGADFATIAGEYSDDESSKGNGGQYPGPIDPRDASVPARVMLELQRMQVGQTSGIINTGYSLEIVRLTSNQDGALQASHITFNFKSVEDYINPLKDQTKPSRYINV